MRCRAHLGDRAVPPSSVFSLSSAFQKDIARRALHKRGKAWSTDGAIMLKITCEGNLGQLAGPRRGTHCHWHGGSAEGTEILRVGVIRVMPRKVKTRLPCWRLRAQCPPRFLTSQLPDLILWQHEGKTGGRTPAASPWLRGSKLFQTRPSSSFPSSPNPTECPPRSHHHIHRRPQRTNPYPLSPTRNKSATPKVDTADSHPKLIVCAPCTPSQWIAHLPSHPRLGQTIITVTKQIFPFYHSSILVHLVVVSHAATHNAPLPAASTHSTRFFS
jgi:hypothetical protein